MAEYIPSPRDWVERSEHNPHCAKVLLQRRAGKRCRASPGQVILLRM